MIATTQKQGSAVAAVETNDILRLCRNELEWIALFVTGEESAAAACAVQGCESEDWSGTGSVSVIEWASRKTLETAIDTQRSRIHQLSRVYDRRTCGHKSHDPLPASSIDFAIEETSLLIKRLDVLSRCALLLCGIQDRSPQEAARLLGVSERCVHAAYCLAFEFVETEQFDRFRQENEVAAIWN